MPTNKTCILNHLSNVQSLNQLAAYLFNYLKSFHIFYFFV